MRIETKKLADLIPAGYNPREISEAAYAGLKKSIEKFGLVQPIVWNERTGHVVSGHQRLKVLQESGVEETQVVVVDLDEKDERALNVTQNNPAIAGEFTEDLQIILEDLKIELPEFEELRLDELEIGSVEFKEPKYSEELIHKIIITCKDEKHQAELLRKFEAEGLECQLLIS